jgi:hypothetical protein
MGAARDRSATNPYTDRLSDTGAEGIFFARALSGSSVVRTKRKHPTRREFAYGLAKRVYEFQREIVGRT